MMNTSIYHIELLDLLWVILIGYVLTYIFSSDSSYLAILILSVMLVSASVISMSKPPVLLVDSQSLTIPGVTVLS